MDEKVKRFAIDRSRILLERFEDETVLVNTESGYYYSLSRSGSEILELLEEGCAVDDLAAALFGEGECMEGLRTGVTRFVEQLAAEGIVMDSGPAAHAGFSVRRPSPLHPAGAGCAAPTLERFDDVRDLLLIDPVHQVDPEHGWPSQRAAASSIEPRV